MNPLIQKFRQSIQTRVEVAPGKYISVRRPLLGEFVETPEIGKTLISLILHCSESWDGFTEQDFYPGGDATPVPFEKEIYSWWLKDHQDHWEKLAKAINDQSAEHQSKVEEAKKK
ncbi:hypothetical protein SAMN05216420_101400 [Nitrosospira sp. Nl5]|uniref:hypothetical protein n=1 Tax=Nitrosospira sp. Nl5 TaxID=200120 RepID=UPI00088B75A5|nr:hypothetical protein [Nitrosospira sp. Nl5]SCX94235.1 hypothetical protein SAMN05216420_101400 [Nitrosospira sp. Nl5]